MKASFDIDLTTQLHFLSQAIRKMFKISWRKGVNQNKDHGVVLPKCVTGGFQDVDDFLGVERKIGEHSNYLDWRKMNGDDPLEHFLFIATKLGGAAWIKSMIEYHSFPYTELSIDDLKSIKEKCETELKVREK